MVVVDTIVVVVDVVEVDVVVAPTLTSDAPPKEASTGTGDVLSVVVPSPNRPEPFCPQHFASVEGKTTHVCMSPDPIAIAPEIPLEGTAIKESVVVLFPSCPK